MNPFCLKVLEEKRDIFDEDMLDCYSLVLEQASKCGVDTHSNLTKFLYAKNLLPTLALEVFKIPLDIDEEDFLLSKVLAANCSTLDEYRAAVYASGLKVSRAYYNVNRYHPPSHYSPGTWAGVVQEVRNLLVLGRTQTDALRTASRKINSLPERIAFLTWYGIKFAGGKNLAILAEKTQMSLLKTADIYDDNLAYHILRKKPAEEPVVQYANQPDEQSVLDFDAMRSKMVSRTFAIDKLLERYRNLLKEEQLEALEDALNSLRKRIRKLRLASSVDDAIIKTAAIFTANDCDYGAEMLAAMANKNDKAFVKLALDFSDDEGRHLQDMLDELGEVSAFFRQRATVRQLASIDIELFNMDLGHFTELSDAQTKLLESFNYSANKIDDLISKLKGELYKHIKPYSPPEKVTPVKISDPEQLPVSKLIKEKEKPLPAAPKVELPTPLKDEVAKPPINLK